MNATYKPINRRATNLLARLLRLHTRLQFTLCVSAFITLLTPAALAVPQDLSASFFSHGHSISVVAQNRRSQSRTESKPAATNQNQPTETHSVEVVHPDPVAIGYYKRHFPAAARVLEPLLYLTLGACVALLLLSFLLPLGRLWFSASRLFGIGGVLLLTCAILLGVYLLFFTRAHPAELTKLNPRAHQDVNFQEAGKYNLFTGTIKLPADFHYTVRSKTGEVIVADKRAEAFDSSFLHPSQYEKVGALTIERSGVYEITTAAQEQTSAPLYIARDYSQEFASGRWLALLTFISGVGLWYSGRGIAAATSARRHRERLAQGQKFFHNQKGCTPSRMSKAHLKVYDRALVLTRKFTEREIPHEDITSIEKAEKKARSSTAPFRDNYFQGVKIHHGQQGMSGSTTFWTNSYLTHDGHTDRILREKLREAGYPVRW